MIVHVNARCVEVGEEVQKNRQKNYTATPTT